MQLRAHELWKRNYETGCSIAMELSCVAHLCIDIGLYMILDFKLLKIRQGYYPTS